MLKQAISGINIYIDYLQNFKDLIPAYGNQFDTIVLMAYCQYELAFWLNKHFSLLDFDHLTYCTSLDKRLKY